MKENHDGAMGTSLHRDGALHQVLDNQVFRHLIIQQSLENANIFSTLIYIHT